MEIDSGTSIQATDFRKRIEQLSKSLENRIKSKQNRSKFYFTEEDDEILDSNTMELSSDSETWLYVSDKCPTGEQSRLENYYLETMSSAALCNDVSSVLSQSRRSYDSRTFTRPKKRAAGVGGLPTDPPHFATSAQQQEVGEVVTSRGGDFRMDCTLKSAPHPFGGPHLAHLNLTSAATDDSTMESSLGIIDINNLTESQLGFKMASAERQTSSSTPPLEALNLTYEKNNSTHFIASEEPLNTTFTLQESPPERQNSKFAKNLLPEPSPIGYNSKLARNQLQEPSSLISYSSKLARNQFHEPSSISKNLKLARSHSPESSPICLNSKFGKRPLSESTPLVKNSRFSHKQTNNHDGLVHEEEEEEEEGERTNGDVFSNTFNKESDDLMNVSFPSMMQSSTSLQGDPSQDNNTFEVMPNENRKLSDGVLGGGSDFENDSGDTNLDNCEADPINVTVEKRKSSFGAGKRVATQNSTVDNFETNLSGRRINLGQGRSVDAENDPSLDVDTNTTVEKRRNSEVCSNLTAEKRRITLGHENVAGSLDNFEANPNLTADKKRFGLDPTRYTSTESQIDNFEVNPNSTRRTNSGSVENVAVNNLNLKYQDSLKNTERIRALRERLAGGGSEDTQKQGSLKNLSQITPPHSELLGEPVSYSTPVRENHHKMANFSNGCSDSSTEGESVPSPVEGQPVRAKSVPPPLDGTFSKSTDFSSKKGGKFIDGGVSPLNTTFRKTALSSTLCKSAEALNNGGGVVGGGSVESGPEEDGMSTASDSSFSSSSTHMRSVGEIQSIARLQEESLSTQNNTALRKVAWGGSDSGDGDLTKGNQTAFRKQHQQHLSSDDGNQSDGGTQWSDRGSPSSDRCSPTALNNNLRNVPRLSLKPLSSYSRTGVEGVVGRGGGEGLRMQHARSVEQLPSGISLTRSKPTFGLKRPTVVNRVSQNITTTTTTSATNLQQQDQTTAALPAASFATTGVSRLQAPKPSGLRPPTAIPRPVSRLPAPKIKTGLPRYNSKTSGPS